MTCKEVYLWLLKADEPAVLSVEVRRHLRDCLRCRRRRRRLLHLHQAVCALPPPTERPMARHDLMTRIEQLATAEAPPPAVAPANPTPPQPRWARRALVLHAAAMLLVTTGFFWSLTLREGEKISPTTENDVVTRVLERHLQLAEGLPEAADRFTVLVGMAADLRSESLRLAHAPAHGDLPAVAQLYKDVVCEGILPRAKDLSQEEQRKLVEPLLGELQRAEVEATRAAVGTPADVATSLQGVAETTSAARNQLKALLEGKSL